MTTWREIKAGLDRSAELLERRRVGRREGSPTPIDRHPAPIPPRKPSGGPRRIVPPCLTEAERSILMGLIRDRPRLSDAQIANIFHAQGGRKLHRASVERARKVGYQPRGTGRPGVHLTTPQREALHRICVEAGPDYCRAEIGRRFQQATGATITCGAVTLYLVRHLGLPKLRRGAHAGGMAQVEARRRRQAG